MRNKKGSVEGKISTPTEETRDGGEWIAYN